MPVVLNAIVLNALGWLVSLFMVIVSIYSRLEKQNPFKPITTEQF